MVVVVAESEKKNLPNGTSKNVISTIKTGNVFPIFAWIPGLAIIQVLKKPDRTRCHSDPEPVEGEESNVFNMLRSFVNTQDDQKQTQMKSPLGFPPITSMKTSRGSRKKLSPASTLSGGSSTKSW